MRVSENGEPIGAWLELKSAKMCLDCEGISAAAVCPACGGTNYVPVSRWIRPIEQHEQRQPGRAGAIAEQPGRAGHGLLAMSLYFGLGIVIGRRLHSLTEASTPSQPIE